MSQPEPPFESPEVTAVFDSYPEAGRAQLIRLRALLFETAEQTPGVGDLTETLKWGQPAYLTASKSGTTVRLHMPSDDRVAVLVHCQTSLVRDFAALYPGEFELDGTRAIELPVDGPLPIEPLRQFVRNALTYHQR